MERPRCPRCRNPVRHGGVARRSSHDEVWFHTDCWAETCRSEQQDYERRVQELGLAALLAPYSTVPEPRPEVDRAAVACPA